MHFNHVLVTGGAGYVGAVLVPKLLKKGYRVWVVDWYLYNSHVFDKYKKNPCLIQVKGDIRDELLLAKVLKEVDVVIHLACISNDPSFELNPALGKEINFDATKKLVDLSRKLKVKRFIYASSSSVYGVRKEAEVTEDLPPLPLTDYSRYKVLSEKYILRKNSKDFITFIVRPATICGYSPRMRLDLTVNMFAIQALVNKKITVFGGKQKRPNIHIEDMCNFYLSALEYPDRAIYGKKYNVGYENYTLMEIANMVKNTLKDKEVQIKSVPTEDLRSYKISSEKIKQELGFESCHSIEDAIWDIKRAYQEGKLPNPLSDKRYYNIAMMKVRHIDGNIKP